jgi:enoyl-CoA hydratase
MTADSSPVTNAATDVSSLAGGTVLYQRVGGMAEITLNRPEALNAINEAMHGGILEGLERATRDTAARLVIIRGSGRAFSAGGDLKAVARGENVGHPMALARAIWDLAKPVIAAVHGYCLGQAFELAAVCDLTIAAESATFGEVEIEHGWSPPVPVTPVALGLKHAKEVLLLGEMFGAEQAMQMGLVNRVVRDGELDTELTRIASRIVGLRAEVVAANKQFVNARYQQVGFTCRFE